MAPRSASARTWERLGRRLRPAPATREESGFKLNRIWQIVPGHACAAGHPLRRCGPGGPVCQPRRWGYMGRGNGLSEHSTRDEWGPGNGGLCLHTILVDPTNPQRMWIGISAVGVFRTDDGGAELEGVQRWLAAGGRQACAIRKWAAACIR